MQKVQIIAILLTLPLLADDRAKEILSSTHTERFNVASTGAVRLENSFGEVDIDGWDRPEIEVTVVRSTERLYDAKERAEAQRRLDSVHITAKQNGNDVVISTVYPPRNVLTHPLSRRSDIEISYRIRAPRASRLIIDHNNGGVNVSDISGDIHATVTNGQITLTLASDRPYAIDAQSKLGEVYSDFEGRDQRRHVLGEEFTSQTPASATHLHLRVRVGDIVIAKLHGPPAD
ncbi:MAG: DUF4097 family beta strand repeat-containing protein [Bryobacteraceae bacterium]|jgi:DUF4097 and DUF4098 domain-containing protein YvlB